MVVWELLNSLLKGHEIEKLHAHDGWVKIIQEVLPYAYSNSLFLILVGWSLRSIIGSQCVPDFW